MDASKKKATADTLGLYSIRSYSWGERSSFQRDFLLIKRNDPMKKKNNPMKKSNVVAFHVGAENIYAHNPRARMKAIIGIIHEKATPFNRIKISKNFSNFFICQDFVL